MELKILNDIIIIYALSIVVIYFFHKLKLPAILGFLLTGVITGPFGFGLVKSVHEVEVLAEIGILLLLFTIGIEFSFKEMLQLKKSVLMGGSVQVFSTILIISLISFYSVGFINQAVFLGFLVALSSTAILLKLYYERGELDSPQGRILLSILIFQDIIVVPMILFTPILAGSESNLISSLLILLLKVAILMVFVFIGTKYLFPFVMYQVAKTKSRELFLLTILVFCFGIVWGTGALGLSLALGAFLAGLIISESEYSHQALSHVIPFKDAFTSLFFVSIGMLLDFNFLINNFVLIILIAVLVLLIKTIFGFAASKSLKYNTRTSLIVGLGLAQVGEFSFILAKTGLDFNLLSKNLYQNFLSISIITMAATPFIVKAAPRLSSFISRNKYPQRLKDSQKELVDHLIIVGFGINGRNLSNAAKSVDIPYTIVEMNPDTVKELKKKGEQIIYGDASHSEILKISGITKAKVMVIAINEAASIQKIVSIAKKLNENIYIIVRTRYISEIDNLIKLGADEVIPEEFETSIEIFTRVLNKYHIPKIDINNLVEELRYGTYNMFRDYSRRHELKKLNVVSNEPETATFIIKKKSAYEGKNLRELDFMKQFDFTILAIKRENELMTNLSEETILMDNDIIYVLAEHKNLEKLLDLFS